MGAGASCARATAAVAPMARRANRSPPPSVLFEELSPDPPFVAAARRAAATDPLPELTWTFHDELAKEGISGGVASYVREALGAGSLGQLAEARRALWAECTSSGGGPVSHALLWAMEALLDRHLVRGDFEDGFVALETDVGMAMAEREGGAYATLDDHRADIRRAIAREAPAEIEAVVRRAWPALMYESLDDFDDSDDGDDLALRALLWIGKILRARDLVGTAWPPRRAIDHCEEKLREALACVSPDVGSGEASEVADADTGDVFATVDDVDAALACARLWLRPAQTRLPPERRVHVEPIVVAERPSSLAATVTSVGASLFGGAGAGDQSASSGQPTHVVTIRTAALEIGDGAGQGAHDGEPGLMSVAADDAPRFFVSLRAAASVCAPAEGDDEDRVQKDEDRAWTPPREVFGVRAGGEATVAVAGGDALPPWTSLAEVKLTLAAGRTAAGGGFQPPMTAAWLVTRVYVTPLSDASSNHGAASPLLQPAVCSLPAAWLALGGSAAPEHVEGGAALPTPPVPGPHPPRPGPNQKHLAVSSPDGSEGRAELVPVVAAHAPPTRGVVEAVLAPRPWTASGSAAASRLARAAAAASRARRLLELAANVADPEEGFARRRRDRRRVAREITEEAGRRRLAEARAAEKEGEDEGAEGRVKKALALLSKCEKEDWDWLEMHGDAALAPPRPSEPAAKGKPKTFPSSSRAVKTAPSSPTSPTLTPWKDSLDEYHERPWINHEYVIRRAMRTLPDAIASGVPVAVVAAAGAAIVPALTPGLAAEFATVLRGLEDKSMVTRLFSRCAPSSAMHALHALGSFDAAHILASLPPARGAALAAALAVRVPELHAMVLAASLDCRKNTKLWDRIIEGRHKQMEEIREAPAWERGEVIAAWPADVAGYRLAELDVDDVAATLAELVDMDDAKAAGAILARLHLCDSERAAAVLAALARRRATAAARVLCHVTATSGHDDSGGEQLVRTALVSSLSPRAVAEVLLPRDTGGAFSGLERLDAASAYDNLDPTFARAVARALVERSVDEEEARSRAVAREKSRERPTAADPPMFGRAADLDAYLGLRHTASYRLGKDASEIFRRMRPSRLADALLALDPFHLRLIVQAWTATDEDETLETLSPGSPPTKVKVTHTLRATGAGASAASTALMSIHRHAGPAAACAMLVAAHPTDAQSTIGGVDPRLAAELLAHVPVRFARFLSTSNDAFTAADASAIVGWVETFRVAALVAGAPAEAAGALIDEAWAGGSGDDAVARLFREAPAVMVAAALAHVSGGEKQSASGFAETASAMLRAAGAGATATLLRAASEATRAAVAARMTAGDLASAIAWDDDRRAGRGGLSGGDDAAGVGLETNDTDGLMDLFPPDLRPTIEAKLEATRALHEVLGNGADDYDAAQARLAAMGDERATAMLRGLDAGALALALPASPSGGFILSLAESVGVEALAAALARCTPAGAARVVAKFTEEGVDGAAVSLLGNALEGLDPRGYERALSSADPRDARRVRRLVEYRSIADWMSGLPRDRGAELLANTDPGYAAQICKNLKKGTARGLFDAMGADDAKRLIAGQDTATMAHLAELMGGDVLAKCLASAPDPDAANLLAALRRAAALECCAAMPARRLAGVVMALPTGAFETLCAEMPRHVLRKALEEAVVGPEATKARRARVLERCAAMGAAMAVALYQAVGGRQMALLLAPGLTVEAFSDPASVHAEAVKAAAQVVAGDAIAITTLEVKDDGEPIAKSKSTSSVFDDEVAARNKTAATEAADGSTDDGSTHTTRTTALVRRTPEGEGRWTKAPPPASRLLHRALKNLPLDDAALLADAVAAIDGAAAIDALAHLDDGDDMSSSPHAWSVVAAWEAEAKRTSDETSARELAAAADVAAEAEKAAMFAEEKRLAAAATRAGLSAAGRAAARAEAEAWRAKNKTGGGHVSGGVVPGRPLIGGGHAAAGALGRRLAELASDRLAAGWVVEQAAVGRATRAMRLDRNRREREAAEKQREAADRRRREATAAAMPVVAEVVRRAVAVAANDEKLLAQIERSSARREARERERAAEKQRVEALRVLAEAAEEASMRPTDGGATSEAARGAGGQRPVRRALGYEDDAVHVAVEVDAEVDATLASLVASIEAAEAAANDLAAAEADEAARSAVLIQSCARAMQSKRVLALMRARKAERDAAASKIQARVRGARAREDLPRVRVEEAHRVRQITKMQARFRGAVTRKIMEETKRRRQRVSAFFLSAALQSRRDELRRRAIADAEADLGVARDSLRAALTPYREAQTAVQTVVTRDEIVLVKRMLKSAPDVHIDVVLKCAAMLLGRGMKVGRSAWRALLDQKCDLVGEIGARDVGGPQGVGPKAFVMALRAEMSGVSEARSKKLGRCVHALWTWVTAAIEYQEAHDVFWPFAEKFLTAKRREREARAARVGPGQSRYRVIVHTSDVDDAGTDGDVYVRFSGDINGSDGWTEWTLLCDGADNFERNLTEEFTVVTRFVGARPTALQLRLEEPEPDFDAEAEQAVKQALKEAESAGEIVAAVNQPDQHVRSKATASRVSRSSRAAKALELASSGAGDVADAAMQTRAARESLHEDWLRETSWLPRLVEIVDVAHGARTAFIGGGLWVKPNDPYPINLDLVSPDAETTAYRVTVLTANIPGAGTDAGVTIRLCGYPGGAHSPPVWSAPSILDSSEDDFEPGKIDEYVLEGMPNLGPITAIDIGIDRRIAGDGGLGHEDDAAWHLQFIEVTALATGDVAAFPVDARLSLNLTPRVKVSAAAGISRTPFSESTVEDADRTSAALEAAESRGAEAAALEAAADAAADVTDEVSAADALVDAEDEDLLSTSATAAYRVTVKTALGGDTGTDGQVFVRLFGSYEGTEGENVSVDEAVEAWSGWFLLAPSRSTVPGFAAGSAATWEVPLIVDLGEITRVELRLLPAPPRDESLTDGGRSPVEAETAGGVGLGEASDEKGTERGEGERAAEAASEAMRFGALPRCAPTRPVTPERKPPRSSSSRKPRSSAPKRRKPGTSKAGISLEGDGRSSIAATDDGGADGCPSEASGEDVEENFSRGSEDEDDGVMRSFEPSMPASIAAARAAAEVRAVERWRVSSVEVLPVRGRATRTGAGGGGGGSRRIFVSGGLDRDARGWLDAQTNPTRVFKLDADDGVRP